MIPSTLRRSFRVARFTLFLTTLTPSDFTPSSTAFAISSVFPVLEWYMIKTVGILDPSLLWIPIAKTPLTLFLSPEGRGIR
jgi:hypothetical protein